MNFTDYLFENSRFSGEDCIRGISESISYVSLYSRMNAFAQYLQETIGHGNQILLMADNSVFFVVSYLAIIRSGNIAVVQDVNVSEKNFYDIVSRYPLRLACMQEKYAAKFPAGIEGVISESDCNHLSTRQDFSCTAADPADDDTAVILFTTGSTGAKKGVMLSHKNLRANTESIIQYLSLGSADTIYVVLPFSYTFGASLLHTHIRVGGGIVLGNAIFFGSIPKDLNTYRCTGFAGVPGIFQILINKTRFLPTSYTHLRYLQQAGGRLANKYILKIHEALPGIEFFTMYGMTEATARIAYLPPHQVMEKTGSIGIPIPGVVITVVDENNNPVAPGQIGEITVSGDNIMKGYYNDPASTETMIRNGMLFTGDLATIDDDGYLYFIGRKSNFIKTLGYKVSPVPIEDAINSIQGVSNCVVFGVPDDLRGQAIKALVQPLGTGDVTMLSKAILSECRKKLPSHMVPHRLEFTDNLPLNTAMKVDMRNILTQESRK